MRSLLRFGALGGALVLTALPRGRRRGIGRRRGLLLAGAGQRIELDDDAQHQQHGEPDQRDERVCPA